MMHVFILISSLISGIAGVVFANFATQDIYDNHPFLRGLLSTAATASTVGFLGILFSWAFLAIMGVF